MAATDRRASFTRFALIAISCMPWSLGACTQAARSDDGLSIVDAGKELAKLQQVQSTPMGGGDGGDMMEAPPPCKNVAAFTQYVTPRFVAKCVRCHDGTKGKATMLLNISTVRDKSAAAQQTACANTLATTNPVSKMDSTIFTSSNPMDPMVHDFKFPTATEYAAYRDDVMKWLQTE